MPFLIFNNYNKMNRKYILITIIFIAIVGGVVLSYQYWLAKKEVVSREETELAITEAKPVEVLFKDLKTGRNEIKGMIIEKIEPKLLCNVKDLEELEKEFIGYIYKGMQMERGWYQVICDVESKAQVKMIGLDMPDLFWVAGFNIIDKSGNIVDEQEPLEFYRKKLKIYFFRYVSKIYFLLSNYEEGAMGNYDLYVIDQNENVKPIFSWSCNEYIGEFCMFNYALRYKNNLYLKVGEEIWDFGEDDILKNKFPANKIIIKDSEISFE